MECLGIPEISFDELAARLWGDGKRLPLAGALELTERCNLRCVQCYVRQQAGARDLREKELTYEQWAGILDQLVEAGCLKVLLTGGEILLRPDFADIYLYAKEKGFLVSVFTNGTLLTPEIADLFYEWPPQILGLSLYGATRETYEGVTGVPGSYERCMRGIELLHERGIKIDLKSTLIAPNQHEYWAMREFAEGLGLRLRHDAVMWPGVDGVASTQAIRLPPEKVVEFDFVDPETMDAWIDANRGNLAAPNSDLLYNCGAGVRGFYINPYGQLGMCLMSRATDYSVVEGSFAEGWNDYLPRLRYKKATRDLPCRDCEIAALCARCPAFAEWENGDPETVVDYVCRVAHERARALGLQLASRPSPL